MRSDKMTLIERIIWWLLPRKTKDLIERQRKARSEENEAHLRKLQEYATVIVAKHRQEAVRKKISSSDDERRDRHDRDSDDNHRDNDSVHYSHYVD